MKPIIIFLFGLIFAQPWASLWADTDTQAMDHKIERFAKAWNLETAPSKKMSLCIRAIDEDLIKRGEPVEIIDRLFGTHFAKKIMAHDEIKGYGAVYFSPQPTQDGYNQIAPLGWYLGIEWDQTRTIQNYYLSNLHK